MINKKLFMTSRQKIETEEKIWNLLIGYEEIYKKVQPTLSFSTDNKIFLMKNELLEKLPKCVKEKLLKLLVAY